MTFLQAGGTPIQPEDPRSAVAWQALWLKDPVFDGVPYRELIDPGRREDLNGDIRNVHTLFRRELRLADRPIRAARLYITADDCYKLYLNGRFVGLGPAPAFPFDYPYNAWDATEELSAGGLNCIGVHAFYQGLHSLTFPSGDNLSGVLVQLEVEYESDEGEGRGRGKEWLPQRDVAPSHSTLARDTFVSDDTWRCLRVDAYPSWQVLGYQTAFSEHIDLRKLPVEWSEVGYDDSDWVAATASPVPEHYRLSPQVTPPLSVSRRPPVRIVKKGDGQYVIDFGTELAGETAFRVSGAAGHQVEIRHGEELDGPESVRYDMRCNCQYQEFCTLSGRENETLAFFDYKGFRYVEVLNWPEELTSERVWAHERHYPFPEDASAFACSNPLLNDIWALCRNGVRVGTLDTYLDCPTREKGGFMGDGFVTGISHLILTGDARVMRKFLQDVANTNHYCPGLLSTAPNYVNGELAEYSLLWPVLLEYYYQWTGDLAFLEEMLPVLEGLLKYYAAYEREDGLLQDVFSHATKRYSVLVDWPKNLRDGYDDPFLMGARTEEADPEGVVNTMVQGFYAGALQTAGRLAEISGSETIRRLVAGRSDRLRAAVMRQLRDPATGLFVDRNGSRHSSLHANVTPLMAGMLAAEERGAAVELIRKKRLGCGVYFSCFVLKALYDAGEAELAYDLMTSQDLHSWHSMLEAGATTCMEAWAPDLKWNTSWCHPWSSAPIHMLAHELMGLKPQAPGWREVRFAPRPPRGLESANITLTTPQGKLHAAFRQGQDRITYELGIPDGCRAICVFDGAVESVSVDGTKKRCAQQLGNDGLMRLVVEEPLTAGAHTITVER